MIAKVFIGPWWCATCSRSMEYTLATNHGLPCCPSCGSALERQGEGDDDQDA